MGIWVRQMLPPVGCDNSCLLRGLWWLSQERRSLQNAIWKRHCSCSTTITKTNKPRSHLGKNVPLWCSTAEWQRTQWKNPPYCMVTSLATKILHQIPQALMQGRNVPKILGGNYIFFVYYFLYKCVHLSVNVCDWLFRLYSSFNYGNVCILFYKEHFSFFFSLFSSFHPNFWRCMGLLVCS